MKRRSSLWLRKNVETSQYTQMKREEREKKREKGGIIHSQNQFKEGRKEEEEEL